MSLKKKILDDKDEKDEDREDEASLGGSSIAGWIGPLGAGSGQSYEKLAKQNASFFGGGSLVNPGSPARIVKQAEKFADGTAGRSKKRRKRKKSKN